MTGSGRQRARLERDLRRESIIAPNPTFGLVAMNGPTDPEASLVIRGGEVVELDGRVSAEFDLIDRFIIANGLDLEVAKPSP